MTLFSPFTPIGRFKLSLLLLGCMLSLTACRDDEMNLTLSTPTSDQSTYEWIPSCDVYTIPIQSTDAWKASSDADWLFIPNTTGEGDTTLVISVQENADEGARTAIIRLENANAPDKYSLISIRQQGTTEYDDNALLLSDLIKNYGVGWGYDGFGEYASQNYIKGQVLDYQRILALEKELNESFCSDQPQYYLEYQKTTAHSIEEYTKSNTEKSTSRTNIGFYKKETEKQFTTEHTTNTDRSYATLSMLNIVAQRYVSEGGLRALLDNKHTEILAKNFRDKAEALNNNPSEELAKQFVKEYGTSVITTAYLGGRLDYSLSIVTTKTTNIETTVTSTQKKLFGKSSSMTEEEVKISTQISTDYDCNYTVRGGEEDRLRKKIGDNIKNKQGIKSEILAEWESDFNNAEEMLKSKKATLIDFHLIPIYEFIPASLDRAIAAVQKAIDKEAKNPVNCFAPQPMGKIDLSDAGFPGNVNLISINNKPMAEANLEYIPSIRTDKPVKVVYPIGSDGKPDLYNGFFAGDGEGHAPGRIFWSKEKGVCIYSAEPGYSTTEQLDSVYVYKNYIYPKREDFLPEQSTPVKLTNMTLTFDIEQNGNEDSYIHRPVTKIGLYHWIALPNKKDTYSHYFLNYNLMLSASTWDSGDSECYEHLCTFLSGSSLPLFKGGATGIELPFHDNYRTNFYYHYTFIGTSGILEYGNNSDRDSKHYGPDFIYPCKLYQYKMK